MYGDVNDDGKLSIDDATALINYLLYHDATLVNMENADVVNDGQVNIDDVVALINMLLSHIEWSHSGTLKFLKSVIEAIDSVFFRFFINNVGYICFYLRKNDYLCRLNNRTQN